MGLQDTRGHLRDFGTRPSSGEEGIHQLQHAHPQSLSSLGIGLLRAVMVTVVFAELWLRRDGGRDPEEVNPGGW